VYCPANPKARRPFDVDTTLLLGGHNACSTGGGVAFCPVATSTTPCVILSTLRLSFELVRSTPGSGSSIPRCVWRGELIAIRCPTLPGQGRRSAASRAGRKGPVSGNTLRWLDDHPRDIERSTERLLHRWPGRFEPVATSTTPRVIASTPRCSWARRSPGWRHYAGRRIIPGRQNACSTGGCVAFQPVATSTTPCVIASKLRCS